MSPARQQHDPIGEAEPLQHLLGARGHALVLGRRMLRCGRPRPARPCRTGAGGSCRGCPCPAAPASERKHGVHAVKRSGSAPSSRISPATRLVSGTSAVGISHSPSVVRNISSANFGNWPVPNTASSRTNSGGDTSVIAELARVQIEHELARAPAPAAPARRCSTTNRDPESLPARAKSISPSRSPIASCDSGAKLKRRRLAVAGAAPGWRSRRRRPAHRRPAGSGASRGSRRFARAAAPLRRLRRALGILVGRRPVAAAARSSSPRFFGGADLARRSRLRRACASWARVSAARQAWSSARISSARGGKPRRARPRSNSAGCSRIHLISCIAELKHKRNASRYRSRRSVHASPRGQFAAG